MPSKRILKIVDEEADAAGIPKALFRAILGIESSFNPSARSGSYKGLGQLSKAEFAKYGDGGDIYSARSNARATARKIAAEMKSYKARNGRMPTADEVYMIHQQGESGSRAHDANPEGVAWKNVRRFYKNDETAKSAIWGNTPTSYKTKFGDVDNITSQDFLNLWKERLGRGMQGGESEFDAAPAPLIEREAGTGNKAVTQKALLNIKQQAEPFFTKDRLEQVFGHSFGDLYQNEADLPPAPPLFKDLFGD